MHWYVHHPCMLIQGTAYYKRLYIGFVMHEVAVCMLLETAIPVEQSYVSVCR